jgi:hypothetical protein
MSINFLSINPAKTEFLLAGQPRKLAKLDNPSISFPNLTLYSAISARNLGFIFDSKLSFIEHKSAIFKSCLNHIRNLKHLMCTIDQHTACIVAIALIHSKHDDCNSLLLNLPPSHLNHLQLVLNFAAGIATKISKFEHVYLILKYLHCLKINERINTKSYL